jgi:hypothetical protein
MMRPPASCTNKLQDDGFDAVREFMSKPSVSLKYVRNLDYANTIEGIQ